MIRKRLNGQHPAGYFSRPPDKVDFFSSGSKLLDLALGGGWAEKRVSNIVGDKSTGKTLLCIEAAANFARKYARGRIKYRESEAAFIDDYAEALGMPMERVDFGKKPLQTVEDLFDDMSDTIKRARSPTLYLLDSLDALSDKDEMERPIAKGSFGAKKAKNMSELFRRVINPMSNANVTFLIVSQVRDNIGATFLMRQTKRSGGRALDFYASQVLYLSQLGQIKQTKQGIERVVGVNIRAKVDKCKVGLPFREAEFSIRFGYGIEDLEACCAWLKNAKALRLAGVPSDYKGYLREMTKEEEDYRKVTRGIHRAIESRWYEVEQDFLPKRRKYVD